jgi:hypothetical protein
MGILREKDTTCSYWIISVKQNITPCVLKKRRFEMCEAFPKYTFACG